MPFQFVSDREKLLLERARAMEYREVARGRNLSIHFYLPKNLEEGPARPVFLFFNAGGWDRGNVVQFAPQALFYVERGVVCGLAEYRNRTSHPDSTPIDSLRDGRSAIRFVRRHQANLHVDPQKLVAFGAGAGANIVGSASLKTRLSADESEYDLSAAQPDAAVMFSAIVEVARGTYGFDQFSDPSDCAKASLTRCVEPGAAPMLLIHGTADRLASCDRAADFATAMRERKNECEFVEFEGRDHSFFNWNVDPASYEACLACVDDFLDRRGVLKKSERDDETRIISRREEDY
ncbi:MAG: alpha/beta hydrolase [Verrucomicrobiales bacterium]